MATVDPVERVLARYLRGEKEFILSRWIEICSVDPRLTLNPEHTREYFVNQVPKLFEMLCAYIESPFDLELNTELKQFARDYAILRVKQGYKCSELAREFINFGGPIVAEDITKFMRNNLHYDIELSLEMRRRTIEFISVVFMWIAETYAGAESERVGRYIEEIEKGKEELRRTVMQLKRTDVARLRSLRTLAHDLGNFLNTMVVSMAVKEREKNEIRKNLAISRIKSTITTMRDLVDQLLSFSTLISGQATVRNEEKNITEIINEVYSAFKSQAEEKGLIFRVRNLGEDLIGITDEIKLKQILFNLVSNAIKYTGRGNIQILLRHNEETYSIIIQDTGRGISEDQLPDIFEEFYRAPESADRIKKGFGLGLAITQQLTQILGGTIQVRSVLERGTTFELTFPKYGP